MRVRIVRLGIHAARLLRRHPSATVAAVFERSLHVEACGDFLCLGGGGLGNGPLNAIVEASARGDWLAMAAPGAAVDVTGDVVRTGDLVIDASEATEWQPAAWPTEVKAGEASEGLGLVLELARRDAPVDGLARCALGLGVGGQAPPPLERVAAPHLVEFTDWLDGRLGAASAGPHPKSVPCGLLGMGPGLTPSGDDLIGAALVALHAVGRRDAALDLATAVGEQAPGRTTLLSGAFLRAAADGQGSEVLHETITAIIRGERRQLPGLVRLLGGVGYTSGWDALAGAWLTLGAWAMARARRRFSE